MAERCDRCDGDDSTVAIRTNCEKCGPVALCAVCDEIHRGEIFIENQPYIPEGETLDDQENR